LQGGVRTAQVFGPTSVDRSGVLNFEKFDRSLIHHLLAVSAEVVLKIFGAGPRLARHGAASERNRPRSSGAAVCLGGYQREQRARTDGSRPRGFASTTRAELNALRVGAQRGRRHSAAGVLAPLAANPGQGPQSAGVGQRGGPTPRWPKW